MGHPLRRIRPGDPLHVFNRALGRRAAFERASDRRLFLALLARCVRRDLLKVRAFALVGTHFHLFVVAGEDVSAALQLMLASFTRGFNDLRRPRDGPLWRSRFQSKHVRSLTYAMRLVAYIDMNAVKAGLTSSAEDYPFCSAAWYARPRGPPWLDRSWVEARVRARTGADAYRPELYPQAFGRKPSAAGVRFLRWRIVRPDGSDDPLDRLLEDRMAEVPGWLRERARLADGAPPVAPLADPVTILQVVRAAAARGEGWSLRSGTRERSGLDLAAAGLLRDLAGARGVEVATRLSWCASHASRSLHLHARRMVEDADYAARVGELAREVLRRCHGGAG